MGTYEQIKEELEGAALHAAKHLRAFFEDPDGEPGELIKSRIAQGVVSSWTKLHQVEKTHEGTLFAMASALATDRKELERYITLALPASPFSKLLEKPQATKKPANSG